ncbi:MAG TPA: hypothetical protein VF476_10480 [Chitinophagaceae bacterium]
MTEIQYISNNNSGETPSGDKTIFRISGIANPLEALNNCKAVIKALIEHPVLSPDDSDWKKIFPTAYVKFLNSLDEDDYGYDELLYPISSIVEDFQNANLRQWRWYSSKLNNDGFEIYFEGWCSFRNYWMIHAQNIPYSKMEVYNDKYKKTFTPKVLKDATLKRQ